MLGAAGGAAAERGRYAISMWRQVRVLVRRMYVVDWRNAAYVIAWPLNCFVLLLQGLTYVAIVQPPASQTLDFYRDALAAQSACDLAPADAAAAAQLNADVRACGTALTTKVRQPVSIPRPLALRLLPLLASRLLC